MSTFQLTLHLKGKNLENKDKFSKSDPYLQLLKMSDSTNEFLVIHTTPHVDDSLDPDWQPFTVTINQTGHGDTHFKLRCFDFDENQEPDFIGECYTTLAELVKAKSSKVELDLVNPEKVQTKSNYKNSGMVIVHSVNVVRV